MIGLWMNQLPSHALERIRDGALGCHQPPHYENYNHRAGCLLQVAGAKSDYLVAACLFSNRQCAAWNSYRYTRHKGTATHATTVWQQYDHLRMVKASPIHPTPDELSKVLTQLCQKHQRITHIIKQRAISILTQRAAESGTHPEPGMIPAHV